MYQSVWRWTQSTQLKLSEAKKKITNKKCFIFWGMQTNESIANLITHDWSDGAKHAVQHGWNWVGRIKFKATNRLQKMRGQRGESGKYRRNWKVVPLSAAGCIWCTGTVRKDCKIWIWIDSPQPLVVPQNAMIDSHSYERVLVISRRCIKFWKKNLVSKWLEEKKVLIMIFFFFPNVSIVYFSFIFVKLKIPSHYKTQ